MNPNVGLVPVVVVWEEDNRRPLRCQGVGDRLDRSTPPLRLLFPCYWIYALQVVFSRRHQTEANVVAAIFQLPPAFGSPFRAAAGSVTYRSDMRPPAASPARTVRPRPDRRPILNATKDVLISGTGHKRRYARFALLDFFVLAKALNARAALSASAF
jgi:hypothetical protein